MYAIERKRKNGSWKRVAVANTTYAGLIARLLRNETKATHRVIDVEGNPPYVFMLAPSKADRSALGPLMEF